MAWSDLIVNLIELKNNDFFIDLSCAQPAHDTNQNNTAHLLQSVCTETLILT